MEDPEFTDFWQLLGYRDAITPEIQRAALTAKVFHPNELYYRAPEDVGGGLTAARRLESLGLEGPKWRRLVCGYLDRCKYADLLFGWSS